MPIEHVVLMKAREGVPKSDVSSVCRQCEAHFGKIPGVISASIGANLDERAAGFTHAMVVRLRDRGALEVFKHDPQHAAAGQLARSVFLEFLIIDYETQLT